MYDHYSPPTHPRMGSTSLPLRYGVQHTREASLVVACRRRKSFITIIMNPSSPTLWLLLYQRKAPLSEHSQMTTQESDEIHSSTPPLLARDSSCCSCPTIQYTGDPLQESQHSYQSDSGPRREKTRSKVASVLCKFPSAPAAAPACVL